LCRSWGAIKSDEHILDALKVTRFEHELQDVRMRLDHTQAVYDEIRKKFP